MDIDIGEFKDFLALALYEEYLTDISAEITERTEGPSGIELPHVEKVLSIIVTGLRKSGNIAVFHLVGRVLKNKEELEKDPCVMEAYRKEKCVYGDLMPLLLGTQQQNRLPRLTCFPNCIGIYVQTSGLEMIVVIDPERNGFHYWNWEWDATMKNYQHFQLVAKEYGKLHAVSMALKIQEENKFGRILEGLDDRRSSACETFKSVLKENLPAYVDLNEEEVKKLEEGVLKILQPGWDPEEFNVILHGDFWHQKMMFRYEDPFTRENPIEVVFLDWHHCRIGRPILDIFFLVNNRLESHEMHVMKGILDEYFESFKTNKIRHCNSYSFDNFWDDFDNIVEFHETFITNIKLFMRLEDYIHTSMSYLQLL